MTTGYPVEQGVKALLLQFWEDLSDREIERGLRENLAFQNFMQSTVYNLKKMVTIIKQTQPPPHVLQVEWVYLIPDSIKR